MSFGLTYVFISQSPGNQYKITPQDNQEVSDFEASGTSQVTSDDLENYTDAKDCTTLSEYSDYSYLANRYKMDKIDLDAGQLTVTKASSTVYHYWQNLPKVLDNECKEIKLTDIKSGDSLNLYTEGSSAAERDPSSNLIIQKISK